MANRGYGYQYETSPRKLEPEYNRPSKKKKKPVSKKAVKKSPKKVAKNKSKQKFKVSFEVKFFVNSMIAFGLVFAMIACQALVDQRYKERETLKQEYAELMAQSNLASIGNEDVRVVASEYGMQTKSATLINLGTSDYIESSVPAVETEETSIFEEIINYIKEIFWAD